MIVLEYFVVYEEQYTRVWCMVVCVPDILYHIMKRKLEKVTLVITDQVRAWHTSRIHRHWKKGKNIRPHMLFFPSRNCVFTRFLT